MRSDQRRPASQLDLSDITTGPVPRNSGQVSQQTNQPLSMTGLSRRPDELLARPFSQVLPDKFERQRQEWHLQWQKAVRDRRWDLARAILNEDLRLLEKRFGIKSPEIRETLSNLGICEMRLGKHRNACELLERCLGLLNPGEARRFECEVRANLALCHIILATASEGNGGNANAMRRHRVRAAEVLTQGLAHIGVLAQTATHGRLLEMLGTVEMAMATEGSQRRAKELYCDAQTHFEQAIRIMENHTTGLQLMPLLDHHIQACLGTNSGNASVVQLAAALPSYAQLVKIGESHQTQLSRQDRASNHYNLGFALGSVAASKQGIRRAAMFEQAAFAFCNAAHLMHNNNNPQVRHLRLLALRNYMHCAERGTLPPTEAQAKEWAEMRQRLQQLE